MKFRPLLLMKMPWGASQTLGEGPCPSKDQSLRVTLGTGRLWDVCWGQPVWPWGLPLPLPQFPQSHPDLEQFKDKKEPKSHRFRFWLAHIDLPLRVLVSLAIKNGD